MSVVSRMRDQVRELATAEMMILNEDDREFVLGLQMLMDMEEPIDVHYADRVEKIYNTVLRSVEPWRT